MEAGSILQLYTIATDVTQATMYNNGTREWELGLLSNFDLRFICLFTSNTFKDWQELKTETSQFLARTGCTDYRCWYLMTGTLCWSVTMWSGRLQGGGGRGLATLDMEEGAKNARILWTSFMDGP